MSARAREARSPFPPRRDRVGKTVGFDSHLALLAHFVDRDIPRSKSGIEGASFLPAMADSMLNRRSRTIISQLKNLLEEYAAEQVRRGAAESAKRLRRGENGGQGPRTNAERPLSLSPTFPSHSTTKKTLQTTACSLFETCVDCLERLPVSH